MPTPAPVAPRLVRHGILAERLVRHQHEADHDQVHADVERQGRGRLTLPKSATVRLGSRRARGVTPRRAGAITAVVTEIARPLPRTVQGRNRNARRTEVDATGDVAQADRGPGGEPADEPATGLIVAGEQEVQRQHQDAGEQHTRRGVDHRQTGERTAPTPSARRPRTPRRPTERHHAERRRRRAR